MSTDKRNRLRVRGTFVPPISAETTWKEAAIARSVEWEGVWIIVPNQAQTRLLGEVCPACSALVAPGSHGSGQTHQERHILSVHSG